MKTLLSMEIMEAFLASVVDESEWQEWHSGRVRRGQTAKGVLQTDSWVGTTADLGAAGSPAGKATAIWS